MAVESINFKGIVRSTSPQNNADGNCEEIINLRQENGVWRVVGRKSSIVEEVTYDQVYVHKYGSFENYIGVKNGKVIWFAASENDIICKKEQEICDIVDNCSVNQLNNILLIKDDNNITKAIFEKDGYKVSTNELPDVASVRIELERCSETDNTTYTRVDCDLNNPENVKSTKEVISGMVNKIKVDNPNYVEGRIFFCTSYELFDGSETKPSAPKCIDIGNYTIGVIRSKDNPFNGDRLYAELRVKKLSLYKLRINNITNIDAKYKDLVRKVNVYMTPTYSFYDLNQVTLNHIIPESVVEPQVPTAIPEKKLKKQEVEKMLFYKAASFDFENWGAVEVDFNTLTTESTMPVDTSGWMNTIGDMFVYNNRLHLFNIKRKFVESIKLGDAWSTADHLATTVFHKRSMVAFVYLKTVQNNIVLKYNLEAAWIDKSTGGTTIKFPKVVTFPDSRAFQIVFYDANNACTPFIVKLSPSSTYNVAFRILTNNLVPMEWTSSPVNFPEPIDYYSDNLNLIVSETSNPYYFPAQQSYLMPGGIINLSVNTEQISASQVGMYPLYVFTTEGIYALQVGDGKVLYSNVIPISAEVAVEDSKVLQTKYGVVFVTDNGLRLISGKDVIDLSEPIKGKPDMSLRSQDVFPKICNHPELCNYAPYLSATPFNEYIRKAVMGYDISNNEILISNPAYNYTYVYCLDSKTWHKITEVFSSIYRNLAIKTTGNTISVCDIRKEENGRFPVYIQSRPISMETFGYKKISRAVLRGELCPILNKRYSSMIFASDDLVNWKAVSDDHIPNHSPHSTMKRVGCSFRYFIFMTGGEVESDHKISLLEVDGENKWNDRLR